MAIHKILIQGGGVHAHVVLDCLLAQGHHVVALCDPKSDGEGFNLPVHKTYRPALEPEAHTIVAIGDNTARKRVAAITEHAFINAIHPSVIFSDMASIGHGNMVLHGAIVQALAKIGNHVILNTGSQVDHHCNIGDFVHLAPGAILCGGVEIGEGSFIGAGSTIIQGKKIGKWVIVGAGSVVIDDVPDYTMIVGNPAKVIKHLDQKEF